MGNKFGNLIPRFTRRNRHTPTRTPTRCNKYNFNSYAECEDTLDSIQMELNDRNADLDKCQKDFAVSQQKLAHEAETIEQFFKKNEIAQLNHLSKAYNDFRSDEFSKLKRLSTQHMEARQHMEAGKRRTRRKKRNRLSI